ncbi:glutathione S-transferase family protein [Devosia sp. A16]|uniref:glutathione S-transferase family protein n=1 Tax=Devosia sp. A16 TaxID=1736675 RepID=UPI0006D78A3F|nr:glutathione S-transferase family protein [Devosia sp. A16]
MPKLTVSTFSPDWGLPTSGPFALKLLKWLDLANIPYDHVFEDVPSKGPKGKSPWIEFDGERIGDSEVIIELLARRSGFNIDAGLTEEQRALSHTLRRMLEEHFHMLLEWELFVHPAGIEAVRGMAARVAPGIVAAPVAAMICRHFRTQLTARGIARHDAATIAAKGKADLDAIEAILGDKPFLVASHPSMADLSAYGLLGPMAAWPMPTPVADSIKSRPGLLAYLQRVAEAKAEARVAA